MGIILILSSILPNESYKEKEKPSENHAYRRARPGSREFHPREAEYTVDKEIIEDDIEKVDDHRGIHKDLRVSDSVKETPIRHDEKEKGKSKELISHIDRTCASYGTVLGKKIHDLIGEGISEGG